MDGWPFGEYPTDGFERLGPNVTAFYARGFPVSNSAIVRGTEATLVFDANFIDEGRRLREAVDRGGPPLRDLVLSHVHDDHTLGAMHLSPPAVVRSRAYTRERLAVWTPDEDLPDARELMIVLPDVVVEQPEALHLGGGVSVHLFPEPEAHTRGDLWAFVEPDGVALCGDLWFTGCEPYLGSGSVVGAIAAIDRLRDAGAGLYLPGHGRAGALSPQGSEPVQRFCKWVLAQTSEGLDRGLEGRDLEVWVRSVLAGREDIGFALSVPGFLEDGVAAAVRDLRGGVSP